MRCGTLLLAAISVAAPARLWSQGIAVGASVGSYSQWEESKLNHSAGGAFGFSADWRHGRWGARVDYLKASLTPDDATRQAFTVTQFEGRLAFGIRPSLDAELGVWRRVITPEFATQDIGAVSLGIRSQGRIGPDAGVWVRGAFLPLVRFNEGGSSGTAFEVGLGTWLSFLHDRARAELDYAMQRVDRSVQGVPLPLQTGLTRLGVRVQL